MNTQLETLLKSIEQSQSFTAAEKDNISKAVKELGDELQHKNHDLLIEASLERVRAVALTMKQPDDVLSICKIMFTELQSLGFSDLRNALINFWDDASASLLDYDYSDYAGGHIVSIPYNTHPAFEKFQNRIRSAKDAFAELKVSEEELESWKLRRRKDGEYEDPRLDNISALYYYFYSTGVGALGISTFSSLTEEKLSVLKRFRNVFDFAYRRYMDVALAEAQTREAQIELSLERVRAKAMAMQKTDDLNSAVATVFEELDKLNLGVQRCGIGILNKETYKVDVWTTTVSDHGKTVQVSGDESMDIHPLLKGAHEAWLRQEDFSYVLKGEDLVEYYRALTKTNFRLPDAVQITSSKEGQQQYYFNAMFQFGGLFAFRETEFPEEAKSVMKRFAGVFNLTYKRFLDIQKAEAQARKALIEVALERVRSKAMAMHKSDDFNPAVEIVFEELEKLDPGMLRCGIAILNKEKRNADVWTTSGIGHGKTVQISGDESIDIHPLPQGAFDAWLQGKDFSYVLQGEDMFSFYRAVKATNIHLPDSASKGHKQYCYVAPFQAGWLYAFRETEFPDEAKSVMKRFAGVFNLTYKRFLDIQKAEEQAREAQIEVALERVRSKAMAMHRSDDFNPAIATVFDELDKLNLGMLRCGIAILNKEKRSSDVWTTSVSNENRTVQVSGDESLDIHPLLQGAYDAWLVQGDFSYVLQGDDMEKYYKAVSATNLKLPSSASVGVKQYYYVTSFQDGNLFAFRETEFPDEAKSVMKRFAGVFNLTYKRFLDIQKAEAQARESQIQLALERVRARTMAMQKSDELSETSFVLFEQLKELGEVGEQISIGIYNEEERIMELYATVYGSEWKDMGRIPFDEHDVHRKMYAAWKAQQKSFVIDLSGKELADFNKFKMKNSTQYKSEEELPKNRWVIHTAFFSKGVLSFSTYEPRPPETVELLERFAGVFDHTYTRFLDLKKAEEQAHEARIEASLEKVRGRAMAMHRSSDLTEAAGTLFTELNKLGINPIRTGFVLLSKDSRRAKLYPATSFDNKSTLSFTGEFEFTGHPVYEKQYESWQKQENYFPVLEGEVLKSYYRILSAALSIPYENFPTEKKQFGSFLPFTEGFLFTWSHEPYAEDEINILNRFKSILDLTIRRFLDLQKAEAQTRESQIETGLERVRSRTLAMHSSDELAETAAVLFKQLINLGIAPNRLYIGIIKDDPDGSGGNAEFWITHEDGSRVSSRFDANLNDNPSFQKMLAGWKEQQKSLTIDMQGDELKEYLAHLRRLDVPFKIGLSQKRRVQTIAYFSKGFIGIASPDSQPEETTQLLERFASVFNLTYTRFNDLKLAEAHAISAQIEEQKLREEKKRSDSLLLNILPEEIANELKQFGKSYARKHEEVTILFADIKGFSTIAENLSAEELVNQLDECFRAFDHIVDKHGLEKIKTIGDAYVCACGLPKPVFDNAGKTVKAALDMLDFIKSFGLMKKIQDLPAFEFRVGIHTGPVITGVVGLKKFTYDIWGDAVNMAARMEQHGEAGKINISGNTYKLIKDKFTCTYRGKIEAKNKGEVDMYFVERPM